MRETPLSQPVPPGALVPGALVPGFQRRTGLWLPLLLLAGVSLGCSARFVSQPPIVRPVLKQATAPGVETTGQRPTGPAAAGPAAAEPAAAAQPAPRTMTHSVWADHWAIGLLGAEDIDTFAICEGQPALAFQSSPSLGTLLVSLLTAGVYTPLRHEIVCQLPPLAPEPAPKGRGPAAIQAADRVPGGPSGPVVSGARR